VNLSDAQERCLITLCPRQHVEPEPPRWFRSGYYRMRTNTLRSLVKLGLAESRTIYYSLDQEYRITEKGIALCNSMGD
jgi:hypothetical protein